jgi:hypothetical protein
MPEAYRADRAAITIPMTTAQDSAERAAITSIDRPQRSVAVLGASLAHHAFNLRRSEGREPKRIR